jgi:opacity protein-like surface antigen
MIRAMTSTQLWRAALAAAFVLAAAAPTAALAQSKPDDWKFRAEIYLWFPSVDGQIDFPANTGGTSASVDASQYLESLQFAFMGNFEARKGRWGGLTDFIYLDFEKDKSGTRDFVLSGPGGRIQIPAGAAAAADFRLRGWVWGLAGTYSLIQRPRYDMQVLGGFRYLKIDTSFNWVLTGNIGALPPQTVLGSTSTKPDYWDGIVGVRGRAKLGDGKWFASYYLDVGTGQSDLTWQGIIGIGYAFDWGEIRAAYRYLDYQFPSSSAIKDLSFGGPALSVGFTW